MTKEELANKIAAEWDEDLEDMEMCGWSGGDASDYADFYLDGQIGDDMANYADAHGVDEKELWDAVRAALEAQFDPDKHNRSEA